MKQYSVGKYVVFACFGLCVLAAGILMLIFAGESSGIMKTLPFICGGIGSGILGGNAGTAIKNSFLRKNPQASKMLENEAKDERSITIRNMAKAKAYDLMIYVFSALILAFTLTQADMYIVLALVAAYLFVIGANVYFIVRLNKEM